VAAAVQQELIIHHIQAVQVDLAVVVKVVILLQMSAQAMVSLVVQILAVAVEDKPHMITADLVEVAAAQAALVLL
jgi:hypothetical protein